MNRFINTILKEATKDLKGSEDDLFFRPKDIEKRKKEEEKKRREFSSKIKLGLKNIRGAYENEDWGSGKEKLFLKIFFKLHSSEEYKKWDKYLLKNENDINVCLFDLKNITFWISYHHIWRIFEEKFHLSYSKIQQFMKDMLKKHFKLYEFKPEIEF